MDEGYNAPYVRTVKTRHCETRTGLDSQLFVGLCFGGGLVRGVGGWGSGVLLFVSLVCIYNIISVSSTPRVRGTAWYSLATRGLVLGGGVGGGVGRMVHCNSYSDG